MLLSFIRRWLFIILLFGTQSVVSAQGKKDVPSESSDWGQKEKDLVIANFRKIDIKTPTTVETTNLFFCGTVPEKNLKLIAESGQKQYLLVMKSLQFSQSDNAIKGKLVINVLSEKKQYSSFMRLVRQERPDSRETYSMSVQGDDPSITLIMDAQNLDRSSKSDLSNALTSALLERKIGPGSNLPSWFKTGFREVISMKLEPKQLSAHRLMVRNLLAKKKVDMPMTAKLAWDTASDHQALIATSLVDFLVSSPTSKKLSDFLSGFQKSEDKPNPAIADALKGIDLDEEKLDKAWKAWVKAGK